MTHDLAIADRNHPRHRFTCFELAGLAPDRTVAENDHVVADGVHRLGFGTDHIPHRLRIGKVIAYPVMTPVAAAPHEGRGQGQQLDFRRVQRQQLFYITICHRLQASAGNLHVLLRHRLLLQPGGFEGFGVSAKRLPPDDLAVAKPEGPSALALVSDLTRLDPPHLHLSESDHDVALYDEAIRDDARSHVLELRFEPITRLVVTAQPGPAGGLQFNSGIEQREELGYIAPLIEEFDPSLRGLHV